MLAMQAAAHHSGGMFDTGNSMTLEGTVIEFQWTNPHCWIQLSVPDGETSSEWSIELGSPSGLYRAGWRPATLRAGERVSIVIHPVRDGSRGGQYVSGVDADGEAIGAPGSAR